MVALATMVHEGMPPWPFQKLAPCAKPAVTMTHHRALGALFVAARSRLRASFVAVAFLTLCSQATSARADWLTWTVSTSLGYGYEFHPLHGTQAENLMVTGGLGFVRDYVRAELGVLGAYGALRTHGPRNVKLELRPMIRITPPLIPLYARVVFAGLSPFDRTRAIGFGGAIGTSIPIWRLSLFGEVGFLPRYVQQRFHYIAEARAGVAVRL
jgi:hypothetical protein